MPFAFFAWPVRGAGHRVRAAGHGLEPRPGVAVPRAQIARDRAARRPGPGHQTMRSVPSTVSSTSPMPTRSACARTTRSTGSCAASASRRSPPTTCSPQAPIRPRPSVPGNAGSAGRSPDRLSTRLTETENSMNTVRSADGTSIAFTKAGPRQHPLILVDGALCSRWIRAHGRASPRSSRRTSPSTPTTAGAAGPAVTRRPTRRSVRSMTSRRWRSWPAPDLDGVRARRVNYGAALALEAAKRLPAIGKLAVCRAAVHRGRHPFPDTRRLPAPAQPADRPAGAGRTRWRNC